jgi:nitrate/nitrite transporter NarK
MTDTTDAPVQPGGFVPRSGHLPTLIACFLHFDLSFMLWVLVGALGILIVARELETTPVGGFRLQAEDRRRMTSG